MIKIGTVMLAIAACMGLFGIGEMSGSTLLAANHMVALGLGGMLTVWLAANGSLFCRDNAWLFLFLGSLGAGLFTALIAGIAGPGTYRDTAAITLSVIMGMCSTVLCQGPNRILFWRTVGYISSLNIGFLLVALVIGEVPGITVWYGDRFLGVSRNPNQTALFAVAGMIAATIIGSEGVLTKAGKRLTYFLAIGNLVVGIAAKSSAFRLACVIGVGVSISAILLRPKTSPALRGVAAALFLMVCLGLGALYPTSTFLRTADEQGQFLRDDSQLEYRLLLWREAISLITEFPLFGRGGGAVGGVFDIRLEYEGMEAHNTVFDLAITTGLVGLLLVARKGYMGVQVLWRENNVLKLGGFVLLFSFALFHNLLRQPLFWVAVSSLAAPVMLRRSAPR